MAADEGIHERVQAEIHDGDKGEQLQVEEELELPPSWHDVSDLLIDDDMITETEVRPGKRVRDEPARGRRKRRNEDNIRADKREHSPAEARRIHPPSGYYDEEWIDDLQAEEDYQNPEKVRRTEDMVSPDGVPEDPPVQHQGGGCSQYDVSRVTIDCVNDT